MKKSVIAALLLFASFGLKAQDHKHYDMVTTIDSLSYAVGMNVATSFKNGGIDSLNYDILMAGIKDVLVNNHVLMSTEKSNAIVESYFKSVKNKGRAQADKTEQEFLSNYASRNGVTALPSGVCYKVLREGTGQKPTDGQKVKTHYEGKLISGDIFDSSYERGNPATFNINQVIRGWTEVLKLMPTGSKWEVAIPYKMAYGERAAGAKIKPYSTLIFTIDLLEILE